MKQKLIQLLYDLRHQPIIAWVTLIATAMSIFLIMVVVMMQRVQVIPFSPESCRDRLLLGIYIHAKSTENSQNNNDGSAGLSYSAARTLYEDLDGVEHTSFITPTTEKIDVRGSSGETFAVNSRRVDSEFFKIFDHQLIAGRYFTADESASVIPVAIVAETAARKAFGTTDCIGETLSVDHHNYTIVGVVKDNSALAKTGSGELFIVTGPDDPHMDWGNSMNDVNIFGPVAAALLVKEGVDFQSIRDQVKARYAIIDTQLAPEEQETVYHEAPYDQETIATGLRGSNNTPDSSTGRIMRYCIYAILLIVPAINLSSMLHSRMRRRVSEIGVRRAYGCTRMRIITDIIAENFIITLIGGVIGLTLGIIFASTYSGLYEDMNSYGTNITPAMSAVLNWGTVFIAVGVCFILNLISAAIPAWQASRLNPVEAINAK